MALWGANDAVGSATGTVSMNYVGIQSYVANDDDGNQQTYYPGGLEPSGIGITATNAFEVVGSATTFGNVGAAATGDIIRFGLRSSDAGIDNSATYFGEAVIIGIASATSLTIGSTANLSGAAIAATSYQITQSPKYMVEDPAASAKLNVSSGIAITMEFVGTALTNSDVGENSIGIDVDGCGGLGKLSTATADGLEKIGLGLTLTIDNSVYLDGSTGGGAGGGTPILIDAIGRVAGVASTNCGAGSSSIPIVNNAGILIGDTITNNGIGLTITGIGTAVSKATAGAAIGIRTVSVPAPAGIIGNVDASASEASLVNGGANIAIGTITATQVVLATPLTATITSGDVLTFNGNVVSVIPGTQMVAISTGDTLYQNGNVISLASTIAGAIATDAKLYFGGYSDGYDQFTYGVGAPGVGTDTVWETGVGWVGVTTYNDCEGNARVKKEVLVAMSGITTGNDPAYPPYPNQ